MKVNYLLIICCLLLSVGCTQAPKADMVTTSDQSFWNVQSQIEPTKNVQAIDVVVDVTKVAQTIEGFGTCFNEMGWDSLSELSEADRESIMKEMFSPGEGANFIMGRMSFGANDFALDWYSFNETEGDFEMKNFSIENDYKTIIPFIKNAQKYNPNIKIWASPWSPPSWMKYNKHYASRSTAAMAARRRLSPNRPAGESTYMTRVVDNGLPEDRQGYEGTDMFIQEDAYLKAYALYFSKSIDAYRAENINIFAVMPQNEFNSAQIFPSCCWTAAGLNNFIGNYLGPAMAEKGVEVMFGTMERKNELLADTTLTDPNSSKYVTGIGFQWAGKDALPGLSKRYPNLKIYQTEQECGDGRNNWARAEYSWDLMKHYFNNGTHAYMYWNTSLKQGGISRWGWSQNSLVVVNEDKTFNYTPEYYILKHASHYVLPGAKKINLEGSYDDVLAFVNTDKSIVVIAGNNSDSDKTINIDINGNVYSPMLKAGSINTLHIK